MTLALLAVGVIALFMLVIHWGFRAPRQREQGTPQDHGFAFEQVWIPSVAGKRLFAWFLPAGNAEQTIIILHGWGSNAELMLPIAAPLRRAGLNVLLLDARNHGQSDAHSFSSLPRFAEDLGHAIDWLQTTHPQACSKLALLGHSWALGRCCWKPRGVLTLVPLSAFPLLRTRNGLCAAICSKSGYPVQSSGW